MASSSNHVEDSFNEILGGLHWVSMWLPGTLGQWDQLQSHQLDWQGSHIAVSHGDTGSGTGWSLDGWLKSFSAGHWARPGMAKSLHYWSEPWEAWLSSLFSYCSVHRQTPCIYHIWILRLFPLINCSYCFQFHDLAGKWLNRWPDIFPGLSAPQIVLNIVACDI